MPLHGSDPPAPRRARDSLGEFLRHEAAGGIVLVACVVVALVWANSPLADGHERLIGGEGWASRTLWVNDVLMAIFFLVVGLEIKRELVLGELRQPRRAALPAVAAIGGMVVPALLFVAVAAGTDGVNGWGIPMATDIAMAVGVLSLLGTRVPPALKLFVLALAIVDDLGAIVVIAIFYSKSIHLAALLAAAALVAGLAVLRALRVGVVWPYVAVCIGLWVALHEAGVHPTLAGVALAFALPAARLEHVEHLLHPFSSFVIVPLFALVNAGVSIDAGLDRTSWAVAIGLVLGKPIGIAGAVLLAERLGLAARPDGVSRLQIVGAGALAGIGFTVSIFVSKLAFEGDAGRTDSAMLGVLVASVVAAALGSVLVIVGARRGAPAQVV